MRRLARLFRESTAAALGQPVASVVAIVIIAGMCVAVLLTQGRTVGAQQLVVATLDDAGTRSIIVRGQGASGLQAGVLDRLQGISSIDWASGFGPAIDGTNSAVGGGTRVAVRVGYGVDWEQLGVTDLGIPGGAYASALALEALGMDDAAGSITTVEGIEIPIVGGIRVPDYLQFLEPLVLVSADTTDAGHGSAPLSVLVVVADTAAQVEGLTSVVQGVLDLDDPSDASIETSSALAQLRGLIDLQLAGVSQALTVGIFSLSAVLVAAVLTALVMLRRKDYGRRRALGASQRLIMALVMTQTAVLSMCGAIVGCAIAFTVLAVLGDPQPPGTYYTAIAALAIATGVSASLIPAAAAAVRDPARELRVP